MFKLLLIGQSGAGKTSFLNLLYNLERIRQLPWQFDSEFFQSCNDATLERIAQNSMESKTMGAKEYNLMLNGIDLHITDTPGFGDTEGPEKDEEHLKSIQEAARKAGAYDCCCLIINGRQPRKTHTLHHVFDQLSKIFTADIKQCTIIILTNVEKLTLASIDVTPLLQYTASQSLKDVCCIENPYCMVENLKKTPESFKDQELSKSLRRNFKTSEKTVQNIVQKIKTLKQHSNLDASYNCRDDSQSKQAENHVSNFSHQQSPSTTQEDAPHLNEEHHSIRGGKQKKANDKRFVALLLFCLTIMVLILVPYFISRL